LNPGMGEGIQGKAPTNNPPVAGKKTQGENKDGHANGRGGKTPENSKKTEN